MALSTILSILFGSSDNGGAEALKAELRETRKTLNLSGIFEEPYVDRTGVKTAVFPVTVYDDGVPYDDTKVEIELETRDGRRKVEALLSAHGVDGIENLEEIDGLTANVGLDMKGNLEVRW